MATRTRPPATGVVALALAGLTSTVLVTALAVPSAQAAPAVPAARPTASPSAVPAPPPAAVLDPAAQARAQEQVQSAQAQVDALSAEVGRTTAELTAGTQLYEQGQARLAETQAQAAAARAAADAALARVAAARALLGRFVNAAYRAPRLDDVTLALRAQPGRLEDVVLADATLDHVQGNQDDALRAATDRGEEAQALVREADQLAEQAAGQARELADQVARLTAQAQETRTRLQAAADALATAQAAQLADEAARAQALADLSGGGALCTGASTAGYPNGFLPATALCPLAVGNGHRLRADAAAAFNRMNAAHPLCVTDSYRSYGEQVDVYARKPGLAAVPGTSNHGLGLAVDLCGGVEQFGTPAHQWLQAHAAEYGFVHPAWAEPGGSRPEPWHWEFAAAS